MIVRVTLENSWCESFDTMLYCPASERWPPVSGSTGECPNENGRTRVLENEKFLNKDPHRTISRGRCQTVGIASKQNYRTAVFSSAATNPKTQVRARWQNLQNGRIQTRDGRRQFEMGDAKRSLPGKSFQIGWPKPKPRNENSHDRFQTKIRSNQSQTAVLEQRVPRPNNFPKQTFLNEITKQTPHMADSNVPAKRTTPKMSHDVIEMQRWHKCVSSTKTELNYLL